MFLLADVKNNAVRSAPFKLQYLESESDSLGAYDVKVALGLPFTSKCEAGTSNSDSLICIQKLSSLLDIDLLALNAADLFLVFKHITTQGRS